MTTSKNIALALLLERAINSENVSVFAELRKPIETFARETFAFKYNSELYETEREEIKLYFSEGKDLLQKLIYFNLGIRTENPLIHYHKIEKNGEIDFTEITHDFNYADLFYWLDSERILSTVDRAIIEQAFGKHTGNDPMYFAASIGKNANEYSML